MIEPDRPEIRAEVGIGPEVPYKEALEVMDKLALVVSEAGEGILRHHGEIRDIGTFHGAQSSTVDVTARELVENFLDYHLPNLEGVRRYEHRPIEMFLIESPEGGAIRYHAITDELDGTTNTKRALAVGLGYRPQAAVSIALSLSERLRDLQFGALYLLHEKETFTFMRRGDDFLSFMGRELIRPKQIEDMKGDSKYRVLVIGYSNRERIKKAGIEEGLMESGFVVYEGVRSSAVDIVNVIRGQYDAYIDPRAVWGEENGAVLYVYDVAAAVPIAVGAGLSASDVYGASWMNYRELQQIPLVVARPAIHDRILDAIRPLVQEA